MAFCIFGSGRRLKEKTAGFLGGEGVAVKADAGQILIGAAVVNALRQNLLFRPAGAEKERESEKNHSAWRGRTAAASGGFL